MYKHKINLITMTDVVQFVAAISNVDSSVKLVDDAGFCVNGKSLIGAVASLEWDNLYVLSEEDIYSKISAFVAP